MKFVASRQELSTLIRKIQNIVPQTAPMPILSHILVEATQGDELVFTVTDLTIGAKCRLKGKVLETGALSLPSRRFFQLIRELTDSHVEMAAGPTQKAEIRAGSSSFFLHGMDKGIYPALPDLSSAPRFSLPGETLREMFYRTAFAAAKEESREELTGLLMQIKGGFVTLVATDGKRLARAQTALPSSASDLAGDYVLPIKAVDEMMRILDEPGEATLHLAEDKIALEFNGMFLVTRLLARDYPDFQQILDSPRNLSFSLHREELMTLLRQLSLFTTEMAHSVKFRFGEGELVITIQNAETGAGKVSMPVHTDGKSFEIALNPHFFLDILKHVRDETITLSVSDPYNPGMVTDSTSSLFIIMPMRLHN